jgi:hypothetical protein
MVNVIKTISIHDQNYILVFSRFKIVQISKKKRNDNSPLIWLSGMIHKMSIDEQ